MSQNKNIGEKVTLGVFWTYAERICAQGINFILSVVLARILEPEHYGTVALVTVFISICDVFISRGFPDAVVQKKDADETDFSTAFWLNLAMGTGLYVLLFLAAPTIADFYQMPILTTIVRVMSLRLPVAAVNSMQHAYVSKKMEFKKFFFSTIGGTLMSAIIGIILAYSGFGVWALVTQYMLNIVMDTIVLWFTVKWRPNIICSAERLKRIFSFGWKVMASSMISTICNELRSLLIAKKYSSSDLAYYNKAINFPKLIISSVDAPIETVLFPAFANVQDDIQRVKSYVRNAFRMDMFLIAPFMLGMSACADTLILLLLTEKWSESIVYLPMFCFRFLLAPLQTISADVTKAMGRSDWALWNTILGKAIDFVIIIITVFCFDSVFVIAVGMAVYGGFTVVINFYPNRKLIYYGYTEFVKDIFPAVAVSTIMAIIVVLVGQIEMVLLMKLFVQIFVGVVAYIGLSWLFQRKEIKLMTTMLKETVQKKKDR